MQIICMIISSANTHLPNVWFILVDIVTHIWEQQICNPKSGGPFSERPSFSRSRATN